MPLVVITTIGGIMKQLFPTILFLTLAGCVQSALPSSSTSGGFITESAQEDFNKDRAKIGKQYWAENLELGLCDSVNANTVFCPPPEGKPQAFYGPFKVKDVIHTSNMSTDIFFIIETPDGQTKYLKTYFPDNFVSEDPKVKQARAKAECKRKGGVSIGMTTEEVLASCWGKPSKKNITRFPNTVEEQWVYGDSYVYFRDGIVITIQNSK